VPESGGSAPDWPGRQRRHRVTDNPEPVWTDTELRAIALWEAAADSLGVIPQHLTGDSKAAWRAGFARGWAG
jgi:hypothetical protein